MWRLLLVGLFSAVPYSSSGIRYDRASESGRVKL